MINKKKHIPRAKMIISILAAFFIVVTFAPAVFIANSPQLNPQFVADLGLIPQRMVAFIKSPLNSTNSRNEIETAKIGRSQPPSSDLNYTPIAKGVYAAEDPANGKKYVKILKGTKVEVRPVKLSDGRIVEVYIPIPE